MFSDNIEQIEKLINIVAKSEIDELSVKEGEQEITIRKRPKCHQNKQERSLVPPMPPISSMGMPRYAPPVMPTAAMPPVSGYGMPLQASYDMSWASAILPNTNVSGTESGTTVFPTNTAQPEGNLTDAKPTIEGKQVKSPLVGTFYAASSPEAEPFVKKGDVVKKGQVLGIVEAMKLMNEIECEYDGVVADILVKNEEMVEYGQPLFIIQ